MRRFWLALLVAMGLLVMPASPATSSAAQIKHWHVDSRFVDASKITFTPSFDTSGPLPPAGYPLRSLPVNVYLPDGYDPHHRYPVLYLLHGLWDNYRNWLDPNLGNLRQIARHFPGVIVMPEADRGLYGNWWNGGRRGDPAWESYFFDELIPLVNHRLSIRHGRRWHAIAGFSMGGLGSIFLASQRPGYFGSVASFSGTLSLQDPGLLALASSVLALDVERIGGDPEAQRFYWTGHNPVELTGNLRWTRTYVTVGDGQPVHGEDASAWVITAETIARPQAEKFVDAARQHGVPVTYVPRQGTHDWLYWREHLAAALRWGFFRPVHEHPRRWSYRTVEQDSRAFGFGFRFRRPPTELIEFSRQGDRLSGAGSGRVRITMPAGTTTSERLPFTMHLP